jgi:hypothetical protein
MLVALMESFYQLLDRCGLVARGLKIGNELELWHL